MKLMYTNVFNNERAERMNRHMTEQDITTLEHFGYDKPQGVAKATGYNTEPFINFGQLLCKADIDTTRKTRIIYDYDPNFAHCLIQIMQDG